MKKVLYPALGPDFIVSYSGMVFASGLATTTAITFLLKSGDHLVSMNDLYGGTNRLFRQCTTRMGIEESLVDCTDLTKVESAIKSNTKVRHIQ